LKKNRKRTEKKIWIERGKTALIFFLVFCCAYFLYLIFDIFKEQVSMDKIFWSSENISSVQPAQENSSNNVVTVYRHFSEPETILINGVNSHKKIPEDGQFRTEILEEINSKMQDLYFSDNKNVVVSDIAEWTNAIKESSLYIKYPCPRFTDFEEEFFAAENSISKYIKSYQDVVLTVGAVADTGVTAFVREYSTDKIIKIILDSESKTLRDLIKSYQDDGQNPYMFAYELNLDENSITEGVNDRVTLARMLLLPTGNLYTGGVRITVPRIYKGGVNFTTTTQVTEGLISIFGFNPNTIRQYSNSDGALMFVGETGSLSVHPKGRIEYKALGKNEGIPLTRNSQNTAAYSIISGLSTLTESIFKTCGINEERHDAKLKITAFPQKGNKLNLSFDYYVDEYKVKFDDGAAVDAVVENGVITELKMLVKAIEKTEDKNENEEILRAIDRFCQENSDITKISEGRLVYEYKKGENETITVWEVQGVK